MFVVTHLKELQHFLKSCDSHDKSHCDGQDQMILLKAHFVSWIVK